MKDKHGIAIGAEYNLQVAPMMAATFGEAEILIGGNLNDILNKTFKEGIKYAIKFNITKEDIKKYLR